MFLSSLFLISPPALGGSTSCALCCHRCIEKGKRKSAVARRGAMWRFSQKCTLCMCKHAHPNVANERDPGRRRGAPVSIEAASLSQHRALIFPPPASPCWSSSSTSSVSQRPAHELCGRIDQLIESYCLKPRVIIEGGITQVLFGARARPSSARRR